MLRYVVRRLLLLVPILIGVSILIFFWIRALPGNPASALLGERSTPQLVKQYKERYGLDQPIPVQYWKYVKATLQGDLGTSISSRDRKSTRLNSSHTVSSYAVFCLKKKKATSRSSLYKDSFCSVEAFNT